MKRSFLKEFTQNQKQQSALWNIYLKKEDVFPVIHFEDHCNVYITFEGILLDIVNVYGVNA